MKTAVKRLFIWCLWTLQALLLTSAPAYAEEEAADWTSKQVSTKKTDNDADTLVIPNKPGAALPNTGGSGAERLYLLGSALLTLAIAGLALSRKGKRAGCAR